MILPAASPAAPRAPTLDTRLTRWSAPCEFTLVQICTLVRRPFLVRALNRISSYGWSAAAPFP